MSNKDDYMNMRISAEDKQQFIDACDKIGVPPQQMMRDMMTALVTKRLHIIVNKTEKKRGPYVYRD